MEGCVSRARPLAERKNIRIVTEALEGTLEGDRELMEYAVYNLLTNAVKYSPPGHQVTVACHMRPVNCAFRFRIRASAWTPRSCADLPEVLPHQARRGVGRSGHRIGLSIVEQIVQHHGGKMEVTSQPGQGSCFTVVFAARTRVQVCQQPRRLWCSLDARENHER